jgi:phosphoribosyl 1,2-cyclic phosphodiesterase
MKYSILGSGSKANCYLFSNTSSSCILDNGYSFNEFSKRAKSLNYDLTKFKFILVTHTHKDHISGVKVSAKKLKIPVYIHKNSDYQEYFNKEKIDIRLIETNKIYSNNLFSFIAFETSHDATASVSYSINFENTTFTVITDTGHITKEMIYYAKNSDVLFLEANYNPQMLKEGPYPLYLKKRIESNKGHLSNLNAINFLNYLSKNNCRIKIVYFCHLSEINNSPEILKKDILINGKFDFNYVICPRNQIQDGINIFENAKSNSDSKKINQESINNLKNISGFDKLEDNLLF